ncbi:beta-catenin protein 1 [Danaus plexippus plexippus]|uniref:Beta-catenin-like protein 1 n=1 Tax=Danaus plexippus plexippus TaxID=278856 RepID=A0A212FIT2_DANPL|nr:beta-catenin-like protein 1 [Danaus plexippus plexippus]OWR53653.1 beta-catenin protein 1 [Danaus plexippus plexippus]
MDVGELLSFKPVPTPKRPNEEDLEDSEDEGKGSKKAKRSNKSAINRMQQLGNKTLPKEPIITDKEKEDILRYVETEATEGEILDDTAVKKLVLNFEKKALRNREMRIKFPDQPEKFMESEIDLFEALQDLSAVATVPDQYPLLVELKCINSILELLSHDNTDVSTKVVNLLQELTDVDILHESEEGAEELINALAEAECPSLLLHNLARLDEQVPDERDAVHNTLGIIENITEFRPEMCVEVAKQGFIQWILKRLKLKVPFDGNKLYATEILSILLQNTPENRKLLGELDGIDVLNVFYKRHDPSSAEEQEAMENMFDSLCCALMEPLNRDRFLRGEGLQLMNLMLREKKMSRNGSLKVLDHALAGPDGKDNCNKFVDILGLRTVFPLFMKTPKRKRILTLDQHEEHVVSIISSMLRNCLGSQRQRLLAKFTENDLEKVDRLLELHFKYMDKVDRTEKEMEMEAEDLDDDAQYLKRLSGGLFTLQLIDRIILEVCTAGPPAIKQRVQRVLSLRGGSLKIIRHVMREYAGNLGDAGSEDWRHQEQQHILQLVDKF